MKLNTYIEVCAHLDAFRSYINKHIDDFPHAPSSLISEKLRTARAGSSEAIMLGVRIEKVVTRFISGYPVGQELLRQFWTLTDAPLLTAGHIRQPGSNLAALGLPALIWAVATRQYF
ncbi:hypothetical protein M378DRAFT_182378 [Amanita muscaria Koide BX008]|uniref:Uncharacterized protein n=1 Tax=Amanita muscaria (strain Koide BX008) TaxID=946122 RepID=A0A0C2WEA9_AMAMK|nr:hypothetical protein M378DRAFT_182378 [Amanita muscaria Koide BX008]